jgi:hypothetical protein
MVESLHARCSLNRRRKRSKKSSVWGVVGKADEFKRGGLDVSGK